WIISLESDDCPSANWDRNSITNLWINKVEFLTFPKVVVIAKALGQYMKVETVKMNRVVFDYDKSSVLENNLHYLVVLQLTDLGPFWREQIRLVEAQAWVGVVKLQRAVGEVSGVDATHIENVCL
ncbi:hypothetical protein PanWU01x14_323040, partial [Parasponia andersonii]